MLNGGIFVYFYIEYPYFERNYLEKSKVWRYTIVTIQEFPIREKPQGLNGLLNLAVIMTFT